MLKIIIFTAKYLVMLKEKIISGIQQIGIGVSNVHEAWNWYREHFGMDIKIFEDAAVAEPYAFLYRR